MHYRPSGVIQFESISNAKVLRSRLGNHAVPKRTLGLLATPSAIGYSTEREVTRQLADKAEYKTNYSSRGGDDAEASGSNGVGKAINGRGCYARRSLF